MYLKKIEELMLLNDCKRYANELLNEYKIEQFFFNRIERNLLPHINKHIYNIFFYRVYNNWYLTKYFYFIKFYSLYFILK